MIGFNMGINHRKETIIRFYVSVIISFIVFGFVFCNTESTVEADQVWDDITTFKYENTKEAKKFVKNYADLVESSDNQVVILDETKHMNGTIEYKQTLKGGEIQYLGSLKNGQPDGFGIIFGYDRTLRIYTPKIVGSFSKGYLDGYVVEYANESWARYPVSECNYKKGERDGDYCEYKVDYGYMDEHQEYYDLMRSISNYDLGYDTGKYVYDIPFAKTVLSTVGSYKDDYMTGEWTIRRFPSDTQEYLYTFAEVKYSDKGKKAKGKVYYENGTLKYDGEMNDEFEPNGKGVLYKEDGSVVHKGKFVRGEIKN